jgi:hypothetical protein
VRLNPTLKRDRHTPIHRCPRKSLRIRLGANLGNAFERAISLTITEHLSVQSGQHVGLSDLVGLSLHVWSDASIQSASDLAQSIESGRPLQGLLVQERSPGLELSAGVLAGVRLELAIAG